MSSGIKFTVRALTVLLILCGAALLVLSLLPAHIETTLRGMRKRPPLLRRARIRPVTALPQPLPAPALQFATRDGGEKQLADFKGKLVLVNLSATWCGPCVEEMPSLQRLQTQLGDRLTILAISEDRQGDSVVAPFLDQHGIKSLAIYLDPKAAATNAFGAQGLPTSYLIRPAAKMLGKEEGGATWDDAAMLAEVAAVSRGE